MAPTTKTAKSLTLADLDQDLDLGFQLPDPNDEEISEIDFRQQIERAWQVCDRFDLQTDIWRGQILRAVRDWHCQTPKDREKQRGDGRGAGFLNWLQDREISKTSAYSLIELANSADTLLETGYLDAQDVNRFSKRAFVETAQSAPEVQQMVGDAAKRGDRITRREVRQLSDDWSAMSSDLLPEELRAKVTDQTIPTRYVAPLVRHLEKLPEAHQASIREAMADHPDLDTLKQATGEARSLCRYLESAAHVQALDDLDMEQALEEALRLGCLNTTAEIVNQAAQLEGAIAKLYTTWKRLNSLSERLYVDTGASTPNLRTLLKSLERLSGEEIEFFFGDPRGDKFSRTIRLKLEADLALDTGTWEAS
ncbi:hypothetical protein [Myxacorys almedinensis]|uniref:Uncharacterized protein n=1 Tax=Myxacorys almedinensis A TaxID=2690445 RepID=A0A8J7Z4A0_9CYAN|nr:hypothetical protein [Myxacorys almedinensis]NDJ17606.1 hypothetical protein [Myxacorys almedinensis A]